MVEAISQATPLDVIIEAVPGVRDEARVRTLHEAIGAGGVVLGPFVAMVKGSSATLGPVAPGARFKRKADALHALLDALIAEKRTNPGEDIVSLVPRRATRRATRSPREVTEQP